MELYSQGKTEVVAEKHVTFSLLLSKTSQLHLISNLGLRGKNSATTRVGTFIVATIYLQLIQNRYIFCLQPVASNVEVEGYL